VPIFQCSRCGVLENTALGAYWLNRGQGKAVLCSLCDTGRWHEAFPRKTPAEANYEQHPNGFWSPRKDNIEKVPAS
jgi:hypothetical protein